jgi:hypothetical protein
MNIWGLKMNSSEGLGVRRMERLKGTSLYQAVTTSCD